MEILPLEGEMSEEQRGLELNPITERGDDGEDGYLTQGFEVLVGLPVVAVVKVHHKGVHAVIGIVDTEVNGALYARVALELFVEVDAEVEPVVGLEAVVVAILEVSEGAAVTVGRVGLVLVVVGVEGAAVACGIDPGG